MKVDEFFHANIFLQGRTPREVEEEENRKALLRGVKARANAAETMAAIDAVGPVLTALQDMVKNASEQEEG